MGEFVQDKRAQYISINLVEHSGEP